MKLTSLIKVESHPMYSVVCQHIEIEWEIATWICLARNCTTNFLSIKEKGFTIPDYFTHLDDKYVVFR